jgi:hypothetical protein
MNVSTPAVPATAQISRGRLAGIVLATAAVTSAVTGLIVAFTVGTGSPARATPAPSSEVQANVNNVPLIPKLALLDGANGGFGTDTGSTSPIAQLPLAFGADAGWGTGYGTHPALGNPIAQLPAAFGADAGWGTGFTGSTNAALKR